MKIGIPYERARPMTPAEVNATKAEEEPRLIRPRRAWTRVRRAMDQMGTLRVVLTRAKREDPGRALSRAKAQVVREAAVVMDREQKRVTPRTRNMSLVVDAIVKFL